MWLHSPTFVLQPLLTNRGIFCSMLSLLFVFWMDVLTVNRDVLKSYLEMDEFLHSAAALVHYFYQQEMAVTCSNLIDRLNCLIWYNLFVGCLLNVFVYTKYIYANCFCTKSESTNRHFQIFIQIQWRHIKTNLLWQTCIYKKHLKNNYTYSGNQRAFTSLFILH